MANLIGLLALSLSAPQASAFLLGGGVSPSALSSSALSSSALSPSASGNLGLFAAQPLSRSAARPLRPSRMQLKMSSVRVLYEDDGLVAVDKPFDAVVEDVAQILNEKGINKVIFPEFPDELELAASGVVFAAKNEISAKRLRDKLDYGFVTKSYLALLQGTLEDRIVVKRMGEKSQTIIQPLGWGKYMTEPCTYVRLVPTKGRRHLLRVHTDHAGHPILGDGTYGDPKLAEQSERMMLHSQSVTIRDDTPWAAYLDNFGNLQEKKLRVEALNAVIHYVDDLELSAQQARSSYCDW